MQSKFCLWQTDRQTVIYSWSGIRANLQRDNTTNPQQIEPVQQLEALFAGVQAEQRIQL